MNQAVDQPVDDLYCIGPVAALELDVSRFHHPAAHVDERAAELRRAQVKADGVAAIRVDAKHDGRLPAGRRAASCFLDQSIAEQLGDESRNGGAGQPRQACEIGAADVGAVVDRAQHELLVERARLLVRGLFRKLRHALIASPSADRAPPAAPDAPKARGHAIQPDD